MRSRSLLGAILVVQLLAPAAARAAQPLVDSAWLTANREAPHVVLIDLQPAPAYRRAHIPGSVNTPYGSWRVRNVKGTPGMMPPVDRLEKLIGDLGIDESKHVVLIPTGESAGDLAMATRVYWTLKALGHDEVSILDGGFYGYAGNRRNPLEQGVKRPVAATFKARLRPEYLVSAQDVQKALEENHVLVDSRSRAEYLGIHRGGPKERPGTIPGSSNLPFDWLTINGSAWFHRPEELRTIFTASGTPLTGRQISFCHTGHRTSLTWFVAHELLGNTEAQMYDGSTAEWSVDSALPMETAVKLDQ